MFNLVLATKVLIETTLLAEVYEEVDKANETDNKVEVTEIVVIGVTLDKVEVTIDIAILYLLLFLIVKVDVLVEDFITKVVLYKLVRK